MTTPSWMDANAWDSLSLGGTLLIRDMITVGKPDFRDAGAVTVSQYAYKLWVEQYVLPKLAQLTGESMISGLASNAIGLSAVLVVLQSAGLMKKGETLEDGSLTPDVKGKSMSKKVLNSIIKSTELLIQQQLLLKATSMAGVGIPSGTPAAALSK